MKRHQGFVLYFLSFLMLSASAQAAGLDEMYREIIRSDNEGYLPLFVKNRAVPDILVEDEYLKKNISPEDGKLKGEVPGPLNLTNNRRQKDLAEKARQLRWQNTIKAVQENRVTPLELKEITLRVQQGDSQATEILAWMYARGVGTQINLLEAFSLYNKAAELNVSGAKENALKVYQAMTPSQRRELKAMSIQLPTIAPIPDDAG